MSDLLDKLAEKLVTPENTRKLSTFFSVLQNIVEQREHVSVDNHLFQIAPEGNTMTITSAGITVGQGFLNFLGDKTITIQATAAVETDMQVSLSQSAVQQQQSGQTIEFVRDGTSYSPKVGSSFLDCIEDIHIVNLLKRPKLETNMFKYVQDYFKTKGFQVVIVGETPAVPATATVVAQSVPTGKPCYPTDKSSNPTDKSSDPLGRIIIQEVPVFINKIVKEEVAVYVDRIVKEEVVVYVNRPLASDKPVEPTKPSIPLTSIPLDKKAPLQEETTSSADDEAAADSDEEESSEKEDSSQESSEKEQASEAEQSVRKLKGKFLNPEKTLLRSGDFVYRVNKKINGPSELIAIGRWDTKTQKRVPFQKGDDKIIKKLGHKINK
jgi:hypothetical protein